MTVYMVMFDWKSNGHLQGVGYYGIDQMSGSWKQRFALSVTRKATYKSLSWALKR
jgi:hypothetical protein